MFVLINTLFCIGAMVTDNILGMTIGGLGYGFIYLLYNLAVVILGLAVGVRRLHDVGKSGWFILIVLIPVIGAIWLLVLLCMEGNLGQNKYGTNPKDLELVNEFA
jgi:uncharacterized membrane protein YhaH (DUF805 family)